MLQRPDPSFDRARSAAPGLAFLTILVVACGGGEPSDSGDTREAATSASTAAAPVAGLAPALAPEDLAAYLPAAVAGLAARPSDLESIPQSTAPDGLERPLSVLLPYGSDSGRSVVVTMSDFGGTERRATRGEFFQIYLDGQGDSTTEAERLNDGTVVLSRPGGNEFTPAVEYWIGDRFHVEMRVEEGGRPVAPDARTVERLVAEYPDGQLARLADGPDPTTPAAAWLEVTDDTSLATEVVGTFPPCAELLPPGTVARICDAPGVTVSPTAFETEGRNCNRVYRPEADGSGLVFMVTRFSDPGQAAGAVALEAEPGPYSVVHDMLSDLGDGGNRSLDRSEATPDRYDIRFSRGGFLVEMNTRDSPLDRPEQKMCLSLDALTELARIVNGNLDVGE